MKSDRQKLYAAFEILRKKGYFAGGRMACCQNCGVTEITDMLRLHGRPESEWKWTFFHEQDNEGSFSNAGQGDSLVDDIYLAWKGNGQEVVEALREAGLDANWSGIDDHRIVARPRVGR